MTRSRRGLARVAACALLAQACSRSHDAPTAGSPDAGSSSDPSCSPRTVAVAHRGGLALSPAPANGPVACASRIDVATVDPSVVVTAAGDLIVAPAGNAGLVRSTDRGATWSAPLEMPGAPTTASNHPWLWRDDRRHRLFYNAFFGISGKGACEDGSGAHLWTSDDDGVTWAARAVGCGSQDFGQIMTGPARSAVDRTALEASGSPTATSSTVTSSTVTSSTVTSSTVTYYCATAPEVVFGPDRWCFRSADGGETFRRTRSDPADGYRFPHNGAVAPDGTLHVVHTSPDGVALATSHDDGDTWESRAIPGTHFGDFNLSFANSSTYLSATVAVDTTGNLYVVWVDSTDHQLLLATSRDEGLTWSIPVVLGVPGLAMARYPNVVARDPGEIAVAYYGTLESGAFGDGYVLSDGRAYNAYLLVSVDALSDSPVLWTAPVNDPASPVITGMSAFQAEYLGNPAFAGDTVWAAYRDGKDGALVAHLELPAPVSGPTALPSR